MGERILVSCNRVGAKIDVLVKLPGEHTEEDNAPVVQTTDCSFANLCTLRESKGCSGDPVITNPGNGNPVVIFENK